METTREETTYENHHGRMGWWRAIRIAEVLPFVMGIYVCLRLLHLGAQRSLDNVRLAGFDFLKTPE